MEKKDEQKPAELSNEEIKKIILDSNERQLSLFHRIGQCNIVASYVDLENLIEEDKVYDHIKSQEEREILSNSYNRLLDSFNRNRLNMVGADIESEVAGILEIREQLQNLYSTIEAYEIELSYMDELLNYQMMRISGEEEYKGQNVDPGEIDYIIDMIEAELSKSISDYHVFIEKVSQVLGIIPFRMTKFKYFYIIESTLKKNLSGLSISDAEAKIEEYKLIFDSSLMGNYGVLFDNYFVEIQKFKNMNFKTKTFEELESISEQMNELWEGIFAIKGFIFTQGIISNRLISMYLIKHKLNGEALNFELQEEWLKNIESHEENFLEELLFKSRDELNKIGNEFDEEQRILDELSENAKGKDDKIYEEIQEEFLDNLNIIKYISDENFSKQSELFPSNTEKIKEDYLEQLIDSLIRYINRSIVGMENAERKIRMRRLLAYIDLPFKDSEEFVEYVRYSLDERVVSKEEIIFTLAALEYIFHEDHEEENGEEGQ